MKSHLFIALFSATNLICMEHNIVRKPREWNPITYAKASEIQEKAAIDALEESGIDYCEKNVLNLGCRTGLLSVRIAHIAKHVHSIDASHKMIAYAQQEFGHLKKLSFEQCFEEDFITQKRFDLAVTFMALHWVENKAQTIQKIHACLKAEGEVFGTFIAKGDARKNPNPIRKLLADLKETHDSFKNITLPEDIGIKYPSDKKCKSWLENAGFELISYTKKPLFFTIKNREELYLKQKPVVMRMPFMQTLTPEEQEWFMNALTDRCDTLYEKDELGHYAIPAPEITVFHAKK